MSIYGPYYRLDFTDVFGTKKRIDICKKDYSGQINRFLGGKNPVVIKYKNESDDKFSQISGSSITLKAIALEGFDIETFYTEDEREFRINLYSGENILGQWDDTKYWDDAIFYDVYPGEYIGELWDDTKFWNDALPWDAISNPATLIWSGYLLPDLAKEPFRSYPYEFEIQATDLLGTLSDTPYTVDNVLVKKVDNFKNILIECLNKTDLGLDTVISVNTYEQRMLQSDDDCPLEQTYVDTNRFIDNNNKPYSCREVIKSICNQFTANIHQANGIWFFVDQSQKSHTSFKGRQFNSSGVKKSSINIVEEVVAASRDNIVNNNHTIEKDPAYKIVANYYQYGYLTNRVANGSFNVVNPLPIAQRFPNWTAINGLSVGYAQKTMNTQAGVVPIPDWYAIMRNKHQDFPNRYFVSDPVQVLMTTKIGVSMQTGNLGVDQLPNVGDSAHVQYTFSFGLTAPGQTSLWWNGSVWTNAPSIVQVDMTYQDFINGSTVGFSANNPPYDGGVVLGIAGAQVRPFNNLNLQIFIDEVSINLDESQYYKSAIGNVDQLTSFGNYSKSPEATLLLFADDQNKNRTSWMRVKDTSTNEFVPTALWIKKGDAATVYTDLQSILVKNIITQYQKPSRRFEGTLRGEFSTLDIIKIDLIDSNFMFLSGDFDVKYGIADVVLGEVFTGAFDGFTETLFLDYGDFRDSSGSSLGSISGVSVPPVDNSAGMADYVLKTDLLAGETIGADTTGNAATSGSANSAQYASSAGFAGVAEHADYSDASGNADKVAGFVPYNPTNYPVHLNGENLQSVTDRGATTNKGIRMKSLILLDTENGEVREWTMKNGVLISTLLPQ
jgi:hypothetical protein